MSGLECSSKEERKGGSVGVRNYERAGVWE